MEQRARMSQLLLPKPRKSDVQANRRWYRACSLSTSPFFRLQVPSSDTVLAGTQGSTLPLSSSPSFPTMPRGRNPLLNDSMPQEPLTVLPPPAPGWVCFLPGRGVSSGVPEMEWLVPNPGRTPDKNQVAHRQHG